MALKKVTKSKPSKTTPMFTEDDYNKMAIDYDSTSASIKELDKKKKSLAEQLKLGAESLGVKDDKGSFYLDCDNYVIGKVAKKSMSINQEDAVAYLKEAGLLECITTKTLETVNEQALEQAIADGKISFREVEDFTTLKTSYSVSVKKKEEMPAVEQSNLSVASKK